MTQGDDNKTNQAISPNKYWAGFSLAVGCWAFPRGPKEQEKPKRTVIEPESAQRHRRNLGVLSGAVVLVGLSGGDLDSLVVFGIRPATGHGWIFGLAVLVLQVTWFVLRGLRTLEHATYKNSDGQGRATQSAYESTQHQYVFSTPDRVSNILAASLVAASWVCIFSPGGVRAIIDFVVG